MRALVNGVMLLDDGFAQGRALLVDGARISAIVGEDDARLANCERIDLGGRLLLPGFVDVQVNGGGGVLFNDDPSVETIRTIGAAHRRFGTTAFLPTLITDTPALIERAVDAAAQAVACVPGAIGIHLEGPFINRTKRGTHDAGRIRKMDADGMQLLGALTAGRTLVTLAPEEVDTHYIEALSRAGVVVCAGHTSASFEVMIDALRHGVRGVTHLFNAMSPLHHREPGAAGAALWDRECYCGIIVDKHHVHPAVLQLAIRAGDPQRFFLVTDAMPCVGSTRDHFFLQGKRIVVRDGACVDEAGVLSGSALDMASAVRNAVKDLGLPLEHAARMASTYPARLLRLEHELGRIAPGLRASFVVTDRDLNVSETWIDGVGYPAA